MIRFWASALVIAVTAALVYLIDFESEIGNDSNNTPDHVPAVAGEGDLNLTPTKQSERQGNISGKPPFNYSVSEPLPVDSYLQAFLSDDDLFQTRTLKITSIDEGPSYLQYQFESTEGEAGIITVSPERVFAFIQARDGVYEYEGDSLELNLRRSRMEGLEDDVYRSELKAIIK